jgi:hypothetical protein
VSCCHLFAAPLATTSLGSASVVVALGLTPLVDSTMCSVVRQGGLDASVYHVSADLSSMSIDRLIDGLCNFAERATADCDTPTTTITTQLLNYDNYDNYNYYSTTTELDEVDSPLIVRDPPLFSKEQMKVA